MNVKSRLAVAAVVLGAGRHRDGACLDCGRESGQDQEDEHLGMILVDSKGKTLYLFEKDKGGKSSCYCELRGELAAVPDDEEAEGGGRRQGGEARDHEAQGRQAAGHVQQSPAVLVQVRQGAGQTKGENVHAFGGDWYASRPRAPQVEPAAPTGGGGYGGGGGPTGPTGDGGTAAAEVTCPKGSISLLAPARRPPLGGLRRSRGALVPYFAAATASVQLQQTAPAGRAVDPVVHLAGPVSVDLETAVDELDAGRLRAFGEELHLDLRGPGRVGVVLPVGVQVPREQHTRRGIPLDTRPQSHSAPSGARSNQRPPARGSMTTASGSASPMWWLSRSTSRTCSS